MNILREPKIAAMAVEREAFSNSGIYRPLEVINHYYGPFDNKLESYSALITPIPVNTSCRVTVIGSIEMPDEKIYTSDPVNREVITVIPDALIPPFIINHKVNLLTDHTEVMKAFAQARGLMNRGAFSIETDLRLLLPHLVEAHDPEAHFPLGRDIFDRSLRVQIIEL